MQNEYTLKEFISDASEILETILFSVFAVIVLFAFWARPITVQGTSMVPTLEPGDRLIMSSMFYRPAAGDIVIIEDENAHLFTDASQTEVYDRAGLNTRLIKRVIALSGQTIDIDFERGIVTVDGVELDEPYINELTNRNDGAFSYPLTVPEGYIFVMGDNRNASSDSRNSLVGLIDKDKILGRAVFIFYRDSDLVEDFSERFHVLKRGE